MYEVYTKVEANTESASAKSFYLLELLPGMGPFTEG